MAESPLIGDRTAPFSREAAPPATIIEDLHQEERHFVEGWAMYVSWEQLRQQWTTKEQLEQGPDFWCCHLSVDIMAQ